MPEQRRAVIDRIISGVAVILTEPDQAEYHVDVDRLPPQAAEGSVVLVEIHEDEGLSVVGVDERESARRHQEARRRLEALRRQRRSGRFGQR